MKSRAFVAGELFPELADLDRVSETFWTQLDSSMRAIIRVVLEVDADDLRWSAVGARLTDVERYGVKDLHREAKRLGHEIEARGVPAIDVPPLPAAIAGPDGLERLWSLIGQSLLMAGAIRATNVATDRLAKGFVDANRAEFRDFLSRAAQVWIAQGRASGLVGVLEAMPLQIPQARIVGNSPRLRHAVWLVHLAAQRAAAWFKRARSGPGMPPPMLLVGQSGSGKELLAEEARDAFRLASSKPRAPYITVNCATLTSEMAPSELFGVAADAATGVKKRIGLVTYADGGVLFLDEIHRLPESAQGGLLRFLDGGEVEVVGGERPGEQVRVFVVAATNVDPPPIAEDLYFRLAATRVHVPSLRERGAEDFRMLVDAFEAEAAKEFDLEPGADLWLPGEYDLMARYDWPGNARELRRTVQMRAMLLKAVGPLCDLCGAPGHEHGQPVKPQFLQAAVRHASANYGTMLSASVLGAHFRISDGSVRKLRMGSGASLSSGPRLEAGRAAVPCPECREAATTRRSR